MLPYYFELNTGESVHAAFGTAKDHTLTLLRVETKTEPLYQNGKWYDIFHEAKVDLQLDTRSFSVFCAPYELPTVVDGLRIEVDLVAACAGGYHETGLQKDARVAVLPADQPWITDDFALPMDGYRWRASNYMHTWNGFVHIVENREHAGVYYHRGEDIGALPDRHTLKSAINGVCKVWPSENGDGDSNLMVIEGKDCCVHYFHANAETVDREIAENSFVAQGKPLAKTGATWNGRQVSDPHLHMGICTDAFDVQHCINSYPLYVAAYRKRYPNELLPIAGGYRFTKVGEPVTLSAKRTIVPPTSSGVTYEWIRTDGTTVSGEETVCRYEQAGVYTELLKVSDVQGNVAYDSVMVYVSDGKCPVLPFATINVYPVREIHCGDAVECLIYRFWSQNTIVDFGDGEVFSASEKKICKMHRWERAGDHVLTVRYGGDDAVGIFKAVVQIK